VTWQETLAHTHTGDNCERALSAEDGVQPEDADERRKNEAADNDARGRFRAAQTVWKQMGSRIDEKDRLADPRSFHLDRTISAQGNKSLFLASTPAVRDRPGRHGGDTCVGEDEIKYGLHFDRWVVCGTFMATHTRMTTMEAANESARHAVRAILERLGKTINRYTETLDIKGAILTVDALANQKYNGAWEERPFDPPDVWNPEDYELEDLDIYRRVDRRLVELGLPHCFDILDVDRKLRLALEEAEIYGKSLDANNVSNLANMIGLTSASADAAATKERGRDYAQKDKADAQKLKDLLAALAGKVNDARFPGLKSGLNLDDLNLEDMLRRL
jgi:hypothetical protein